MELESFNYSWFISEAVLSEAQHINEYSGEGELIRVPLNLSDAVGSEVVASVKPESDQEIEDYVSFAMELDDGEAQSLALAKHRGFVLLTDDKKALRIAKRPDVNVGILTTPQVVRLWSELDLANAARVPQVIKRVQFLARFSPARGSPEADWWHEQLSKNPT
jgi:hypothetical protein